MVVVRTDQITAHASTVLYSPCARVCSVTPESVLGRKTYNHDVSLVDAKSPYHWIVQSWDIAIITYRCRRSSFKLFASVVLRREPYRWCTEQTS
jgi:hypothetical protein